MSNIEKLKKISLIRSVNELIVDDFLTVYKSDLLKDRAINNSKNIYAYRFEYISQKHKVIGYLVEPKVGENFPCIIYNRGGSNEFGALEDSNMFLGRIARLASEGYIVIASQYSGNSGGQGKDEFGGSDMNDVLNLYKILNKYKNADIKRIGMMGGSRGGLMTYLALSKVKWIKAAITEFAPTDLLDKDKFRPGFQDNLKRMFGGTKEEKIKRSAIYWVDKLSKKTPILIMHGTSDWRVNPMDSLRLAEKLQEFKVPYRLIMYEGADHGITEFRKETTDECIKWFNRYVKNREKLPNLKPHGD